MSDFEEEEAPIEPELIEASHLLKVPCTGRCGAMTLAVPEHLHDALCGPCLQAKIGQAEGVVGPVTPVIARWEAQPRQEKPRERSQHPAPEVEGAWLDLREVGLRPLVDAPAMPEPVLRLAELAREASWEVRVSYARGNGVHGSTGRPTGLRHSIALSFSGHPVADAQAVATYVKPVSGGTWSWESVWLWGPALKHFGLCSLAELKDWLREGGQLPELWYADVRGRVAEAENLKAQRLTQRKLIKAEHALLLERRPEGMSLEVARRQAAEYLAGTALCEGLSVEDVLKIVAPKRAKVDHGD